MSAPGPIFIVDDDDGHAWLIESRLRESGIANPILRHSNGHEVMEALFGATRAEEMPVLIMLDLNMPGLSGRKVLERIRATPATRTIPIVVLTTTANPLEIRACYELGCNFYLTKPVEYAEFVRVIRLLGLMFQIIRLPEPAIATASVVGGAE